MIVNNVEVKTIPLLPPIFRSKIPIPYIFKEVNMILDKWVLGRDEKDGFYNRIRDELTEEEETIRHLAEEGNYWEAFNRLNMLFIHLTTQITHDEVYMHRYTAFVMSSSLEWVSRNKPIIDEIVEGIGGEGYGMSTSNFGISISVSFGSGTVGTQSTGRVKRTSKAGMSQALRPQKRGPSPAAMRSTVKNPNNPAFGVAANNRSNQMNPNNPAYRSSRGGKRK
jgi:hypothetical protein